VDPSHAFLLTSSINVISHILIPITITLKSFYATLTNNKFWYEFITPIFLKMLNLYDNIVITIQYSDTFMYDFHSTDSDYWYVNFPCMISKFRTAHVDMSLLVISHILKEVSCRICRYVLCSLFCAKYQVPTSNDSLDIVIGIELRAEYRFSAAVKLHIFRKPRQTFRILN
jgi:hypothetical protein